MKFCDKLQKIRKENNVTQEQLADKLGVSRQAVSKWESDQAYPDTEKLIQISKIFNVSLDELINDTLDNNKKIANKKFNFMEIFNLVFEFISKVFNMFWSMKFKEKIVFLFEMIVLIVAIIIATGLVTQIITGILRRIFVFLPLSVTNGIVYIIETILEIAWLVIGGIMVVRVIKTRYLDYYVIIKDDNVDKITTEEPIKELKEKKDYKIVIRDPEHAGSSIFNKIASFFIFCLKALGLLVLIPIVCSFVGFVTLFVVSLTYITYGLFFSGIVVAILGGIVFTYLIIKVILALVFNRKLAYVKLFILFIASLALGGIGIGLSVKAFSTFTVTSEPVVQRMVQTKTIKMYDNLVLPDIMELPSEKIVIDNSLNEIKLDVTTYESANVLVSTVSTYSYDSDKEKMRDIRLTLVYSDCDEMHEVKNILKDLKNKKINTSGYYNCDFQIDKVYISAANLTKIKENYQNYNK